jgi:hypothetical protein
MLSPHGLDSPLMATRDRKKERKLIALPESYLPGFLERLNHRNLLGNRERQGRDDRTRYGLAARRAGNEYRTATGRRLPLTTRLA